MKKTYYLLTGRIGKPKMFASMEHCEEHCGDGIRGVHSSVGADRTKTGFREFDEEALKKEDWYNPKISVFDNIAIFEGYDNFVWEWE